MADVELDDLGDTCHRGDVVAAEPVTRMDLQARAVRGAREVVDALEFGRARTTASVVSPPSLSR